MQSTTLQAAVTDASDHDILNHLNREYIRSVEESDVRWFDAHLAPDFMNSNPDGSLVDRQGFLDQIGRGAGLSDIKAQDVIIRIMGDLAIIHAATAYKTATRSLKGRYTDISGCAASNAGFVLRRKSPVSDARQTRRIPRCGRGCRR